MIAKIVTTKFYPRESHTLKKFSSSFCIGTIDFYQQRTTFIQSLESMSGQSPIETQRIVIRHKERRMRFVLQYVVVHVSSLALTDVRRITHDKVKRSNRRSINSQDVTLLKADRSMKTLRIAFSHAKGTLRDVPSLHFCLGQGQLKTDSNAARTRTSIEQTRTRGRRQALRRLHSPSDKFLRLRTRYQHVRSDLKLMATKCRVTYNVL